MQKQCRNGAVCVAFCDAKALATAFTIHIVLTAAKCEWNFDIDQSRISQMDECHKSEESQGPIMVMFFCGNGPGTGEKRASTCMFQPVFFYEILY